MEEEAWDESIMGPRDGDLGVLHTGDTKANPNPKLLRTQSSGTSAPPTSMFMTAVQSSSTGSAAHTISPEARPARMAAASKFLQGDDEEEEMERATGAQSPDSARIRQEALRMLEVADDQLSDSQYSVYRTKTGGFSATPRDQKRKPAALSGLSFASSRKNLAKPFRDDPFADTEAPAPTQDDYEYGEDNAVVDVQRMENRSAASRPAESSSNWSSRYSIDHTLLALSGGSVSSSKLLDKMDRDHSDSRRTARNMFGSSPSETKSPQVFGSGFSFRQKSVFGQQGVTTAKSPKQQQRPELNLKTVWMDASPEESVSPARSWQEQFEQKRRKRRRVMIGVGALVLLLVCILTLTSGKRKNNSAPSSVEKINPAPQAPEDPSVTFYVTSDVPLTPARDNGFVNDMNAMSRVADFMVHLGDIQVASETKCSPGRYSQVAELLKRSPTPVFIVPGEEDWPNCPSQDLGWNSWVNNFWEFERNFDPTFDVTRDEDMEENFAFVQKGVLFIGVHETNGRIDDLEELNERNLNNVAWVKSSYRAVKEDIRAMVILANGRPAIRENDNFYLGLGDFLWKHQVPTAYIHANDENGPELTYSPYKFSGMDHVIAIQSTSGNENKPLRINVGFDTVNPFIIG